MMIFVSKNLDNVLTQKDYKNLLKEEVKKGLYENFQQAYEADTDYETVILRVAEKFEGCIYELDNIFQSDLYSDTSWKIKPSMCDNIKDTVENLCYAYRLTNNWYLNVNFTVIVLDEENLEDSWIKITTIELI